MEKKELTAGQKLRKALSYDKKNGYDRLLPGELEAMDTYCEGYKQYLDAGKTERECVEKVVSDAEAAGYKDLDELIRKRVPLKAGDKVVVGKYTGSEMKIDGIDYKFVKLEDVLAVVTD